MVLILGFWNCLTNMRKCENDALTQVFGNYSGLPDFREARLKVGIKF